MFQLEKEKQDRDQKTEEAQKPKKENIESLLPLDLIELEVGYGLINVVESEESGDLLERIVSIRKQFAMDLGVVIPSVHIRDNLQLKPGEYQILIKGNRVVGGELKTDCLLAMDPGNATKKMKGIPTKEPAFGLDALWIGKLQKEEAEISGYTVVDLPTVMATHITETIKTHAHELLGRQEASNLIENFKKSYPKVVEEVIPDVVPLGTVVKVLQNLLKEQVSIRDLLTIFEAIADEGIKNKDSDSLTESVRKSLARSISNKLKNDTKEIQIMTLGPEIEDQVTQALLQTEQGIQLVLEPKRAQELINEVASMIETHPEFAGQPVLLTSPTVRRHVARLVCRFIPQLIVVSHSEITHDVQVRSLGVVEVPYGS